MREQAISLTRFLATWLKCSLELDRSNGHGMIMIIPVFRDDGTDTAGSMWRRFLAPTSDSIVSFPSCFADEAGAVAVSNVVKIMKLKIPAKGGKIVIADGAAVTFAGACPRLRALCCVLLLHHRL